MDKIGEGQLQAELERLRVLKEYELAVRVQHGKHEPYVEATQRSA